MSARSIHRRRHSRVVRPAVEELDRRDVFSGSPLFADTLMVGPVVAAPTDVPAILRDIDVHVDIGGPADGWSVSITITTTFVPQIPVVAAPPSVGPSPTEAPPSALDNGPTAVAGDVGGSIVIVASDAVDTADPPSPPPAEPGSGAVAFELQRQSADAIVNRYTPADVRVLPANLAQTRLTDLPGAAVTTLKPLPAKAGGDEQLIPDKPAKIELPDPINTRRGDSTPVAPPPTAPAANAETPTPPIVTATYLPVAFNALQEIIPTIVRSPYAWTALASAAAAGYAIRRKFLRKNKPNSRRTVENND